MKGKRKTLSEIISLVLLLIFTASLIVVIKIFLLGGKASQNVPSQQQYPPPQPTSHQTYLTQPQTSQLVYPSPLTTYVPNKLIKTDATMYVENPVGGTGYPGPQFLLSTFTPYPSPTIRPGPTDTPVPLIQPAADASGTILYLSGSGTENTTLNRLSVDGKGLVIGSNQVSSTGKNLSWWGNAYPSSDGSRIAFYGEWCAEGIFFIDSGKFELAFKDTGGPCGQFFDWHPDDRHILIHSIMNGPSGLLLVDTNSWEYTILAAPGFGDIRGGSISPDGKKVIYSWEGGDHSEIWMVNTDGQDAHKLFDVTNAPGNFAWSPDGSSIVFPGPDGMMLMNRDGKILRTLKSPFEEGCGPRGFPPIWSPDSRFLLIMDNIGDLPYTDPWNPKAFRDAGICLVDVSSDSTFWLPPGEQTGNMHPAWSPDGSQVAFVSDRSGTSEIWTINLDGTHLRQLTHSGIPVRFPFWIR